MSDRRLRPALAAAAALAALLGPALARAVEGIIFSGSVYVDQWGFVESRLAARASAQSFAPAASIQMPVRAFARNSVNMGWWLSFTAG